MNKLIRNLVTIITILAGIAGIAALYFQIKEHHSELEIKTVSIEKLTDLPSVEGLRATYLYKGDTVKSLWKAHYIITNIGDEPLIGEGNKRNIIKDNIRFVLNEGFRILEIKDFELKDFNFINTKNQVGLDFLQWKPEEAIELVLYIEEFNSSTPPSLTTNEREIINGKVSYTSLLNETTEKISLFNKLPRPINTILWWFGIVFFGLIFILMPIVWFSELVKLLKFKKWKRTDYSLYSEWVNTLVSEGQINNFKEPKKLPTKFWSEYPYIKPTLPDNEFGSLSLGVILILSLFAIPLLLLIKI